MNRLTTEKRAAITKALLEGAGINATTRMHDVSKNTVLKLLADMGTVCAAFHDRVVRDVKARRVEADEVWSFCFSKEKNVRPEHKGVFGHGDVWTWKALAIDSRLIVSWHVSNNRDAGEATAFMQDVAARLATKVQLSTDGLKSYLSAVEDAFGADVDFGQIVKEYGNAPESDAAHHRYSPGQCTGLTRTVVTGDPEWKLINTSYVERSNLSVRMHLRRFTRLTNAHSKKIANHCHALALYFAYYNFCKIHESLRVTPAMEAGLADHVWSVEELVGLLDRPVVNVVKGGEPN